MSTESPQSRDAEDAFADHPLAKLPPPAWPMVAAATRLILRVGYAGLTLRAVAAEADVYADSIRYYFGGKSGLLRAVALNLSHDLALSVVDSVGAIDDEGEPSRVVDEVNRPIAEDTDSYRVYWELLPHILADPEWRMRRPRTTVDPAALCACDSAASGRVRGAAGSHAHPQRRLRTDRRGRRPCASEDARPGERRFV